MAAARVKSRTSGVKHLQKVGPKSFDSVAAWMSFGRSFHVGREAKWMDG